MEPEGGEGEYGDLNEDEDEDETMGLPDGLEVEGPGGDVVAEGDSNEMFGVRPSTSSA